MGQSEARLWASSVARQAGQNIQRARKRASMSAQELSDACGSLGHPIPRSTIANIESGRKETVSLQELLVLAEALKAPPITLIYYPFDAAEVVERVPGQTCLTVKAGEMFAFSLEGDESSLGQLHENVLSLLSLEESAMLLLKTAAGLAEGSIEFELAGGGHLRGGVRLDFSGVTNEAAQQEANTTRRVAAKLIAKAARTREKLSVSGIGLWDIPDELASLYSVVPSDSRA